MEISVIIPIYNVENYLNQCIDSVLAQDFTDYEIILIDDGSTDNSPTICDEYAEKYTQIKVIHKTNGGPSDSRNVGIKEAKGDYLIFIDSDDFWKGTNVLSDISVIIAKNNPDLIIFPITYFYSDGKTIINENINKNVHFSFNLKKDLITLLGNRFYLASPCDKVIKSCIIKDNNITFPIGKVHEDVAWCADLIPYVDNYIFYVNPFYYYRKERQDSITNNIKHKNIIDVIDIVCEKENILSKYKGGLSYLSYNYYPYIKYVNILQGGEQKQEYLNKIIRLKYLIDFYPKNALSFKGKIRLALYKLLGIKFAGLIEYNIRKLLKK